MGARKLEGGRQGGVCSPVLPGLPEEHGTGSPETGDLGCGVTQTRAADEEELGQKAFLIQDSPFLQRGSALSAYTTPCCHRV